MGCFYIPQSTNYFVKYVFLEIFCERYVFPRSGTNFNEIYYFQKEKIYIHIMQEMCLF